MAMSIVMLKTQKDKGVEGDDDDDGNNHGDD